MRILIVDDNQDKASVVQNFLIDKCQIPSNDIDVAPSAWDAKGFLENNFYELMILDILIPNRSDSEPNIESSITLLSEISLSNDLKPPSFIVGLTAFDEALSKVESIFKQDLWTVLYYDETSDSWLKSLQNCVEWLKKIKELKSQSVSECDVCIITALPSESEAVRRLNWNWGDSKPFDNVTWQTPGHFFSAGKQYSVSLFTASRMGMVSTAVLATKIIEKIRPKFLVMTGICAGLANECNLGDVLIADPTWDYQNGKRTSKDGQTGFLVEPHQLRIPKFVRSRFEQLSQDTDLSVKIQKDWPADKPATLPKILIGAVASGSAVVADGKVVTEIRETQFRKLAGIEMEIYGLYAAVSEASVPQPTTFAIKSVCDYADTDKNDAVQKYAMYTSAGVMKEFFERYMTDIYDFSGNT